LRIAIIIRPVGLFVKAEHQSGRSGTEAHRIGGDLGSLALRELPEYHLRYGLSVYNLADWKYDVPLSTDFGPQVTLPQPGRRLLGSLTLSL
jgi:hypothetical protein